MQSQTSSMSKRKLRSKTWASILPDDAVLCLLLVLQLVVDDSSHCQGPGITTQESDGTPGHAPQALLHVLMGHLKVGWVSIHIMQVQIQQSNSWTGNRKVASIRNVCSVTSMNLQVWPGSHLGHKPYRKASQWHSLQLPSLLCHLLVIWCCFWVDGRSGQQQGLTQEGLKNTELPKILHTIFVASSKRWDLENPPKSIHCTCDFYSTVKGQKNSSLGRWYLWHSTTELSPSLFFLMLRGLGVGSLSLDWIF